MSALSSNPLNQVGLRDFQRNLYHYIKEVSKAPLILTRNAKPEYVVVEYKQFVYMLEHQAIPEDLPQAEPNLEGEPIHVPTMDELNGVKPSLWQRIKKLATMKIA